jgi:AraC-like DNA-binding protein
MPAVRASRPLAGVSTLAAAFQALAKIDEPDAILRHAMEFARDGIGLDRVGVFSVDEAAGLMIGAWGTDIEGRTVDEHHVVCELSDEPRAAFRRAADEGVLWTLVEACPIVVQRKHETVVLGRGCVVCTPIASDRRPIGMMFNDTGLSGRPIDDAKQTHLAILCAFLATILDRSPAGSRRTATSAVVAAVARALAGDPSLSVAALAKVHGVSQSRLARRFKSEMGLSLVEHRNRLRMARFFSLLGPDGRDLLEAALDAGFGSYAQFHRVFRALHGGSPREYLRARRPASGPSVRK